MREAFSVIWQMLSVLIGTGVFLFLMWAAAQLHSRMWRRVADRYRGRSQAPQSARKFPETIIIAERGPIGPAGYRAYAATAVAVHEDGIQLSQVPPFNVMAPSVFLPFGEMELVRTTWALWPDPMAIRTRGLPHTDIILARETVQWVRGHTTHAPFGWEA